MADDSSRTLLNILRTSLYLVGHYGDFYKHGSILSEVKAVLERAIAELEASTPEELDQPELLAPLKGI
jgi:hypothetical protein